MSGFGIDRSSVASGSGASASSIPEAIIDAKGDLIAGSAADTPVRVAVGANETRLVADSAQAAGVKYVADTVNYAVAAKGDLLVGTAADTVAPLAVGAVGELPFPVSAASTGLAWLRAPHPGAYIINGKVNRTVSGGALTIAIKTLADADPSTTSPVYVLMPTVASNVHDGGYAVRSITAALSMTVSSGSTLGHASGTLSPVYIYLLDNAGTIEVAVSSTFYGGSSVQTTVAEGGAGAADDTVLYSTTLRSNVAVVCLQRWESTQTTAGTWAATTGEVQSYPGGDSIPTVAASSPYRKNAIINGDFNVWQRGTSFASIATGVYSADRWRYQKSGAMVHDVSRSPDVPTLAQAGRLFNYSLLADCTTIDAAIAAGDFAVLEQLIEGYNWLPLAQRAVTLSFLVKATKTGTYCVSLANSTPDRTYVGEYAVNAADTWEKKTVSLTASPSAGTWNYTTGIGLHVRFALAAGSTFQTTANAWNTGNFLATANQVNACDAVANKFRIAGVQLEAGSVATEFEQRTFKDELALCQRYYERVDVLFHTSAFPTMVSAVNYAVAKRAVPTLTATPATGSGGVFAALEAGVTTAYLSTANSTSIGGFITVSAEL